MKKAITNVSKLLLVASGKGGVGKSTIALNLAVLLAQRSRVGLIDADIHGPSLSFMLGADVRVSMSETEKLIPLEKFGLKYISMGAMVDADAPIIWRGPMLSKILHNFLLNTLWNELDYLIVDTPPGTGDVHITLCNEFYPDGVILVTTAQKVALKDVARANAMFRKLGAPVLGIVENMSYMDSITGEKYIIGEKRNVTEFASSVSMLVLGRVPFISQISHSGDSAVPPVLDPEIASIYNPIVEQILSVLRSS
ncbi:cobQ/CobB/MinD/ParA nucleotide binding domain protein [Neorickettsia helminthoeca str. Oregon]|uniref:Iron-sulfur cluster carrier protein n=1 Tax=Neorickettsia helminthoeca str. Oregon TaxID=1286528 RepID=X5H4Y4_9RICK|nr:P-loop NTPase [Neorickettsia helminthoeca]AHX11763.1 cobQ/CobB/MinD/ParA nucleotide binding domain protein [Neorickettsia helminthoeca str. Oregon]